MTVTDRTDATDAEFRSRIAPFESAATPPEVVEAAATVERIVQVFINEGLGAMQMDDLRRLAAAAVAAYRAAQDGGAEETPWCNLPICPEGRERPHRITAGRCMVVPS